MPVDVCAVKDACQRLWVGARGHWAGARRRQEAIGTVLCPLLDWLVFPRACRHGPMNGL